jgi:hypothetical protein
VNVAAEASPRCDLIIVPDAQRAPAARIGKREMVLGLEPDALITRKRLKEPTIDHDLALRRLCRVSWLQCFSRKIETFETFGFRKCTLRVQGIEPDALLLSWSTLPALSDELSRLDRQVTNRH